MTFLAGGADVGHIVLLRRRQRGDPIRRRQQRQVQFIPFAVEIGPDDSVVCIVVRRSSRDAAIRRPAEQVQHNEIPNRESSESRR